MGYLNCRLSLLPFLHLGIPIGANPRRSETWDQIVLKCDIYSYGVILGVLVIGKLPSDDFFQHTEEMSLVKWMRKTLSSENPKEAINSKLLGNGYEEQMLLVLKIACFCTMDDPKERPNSKDVRCMLSQIKH